MSGSLEEQALLARFGAAPRSLRVPVPGAELHVLEWGEPDAQPVLLVHGMRAHARWFTPVGPALAPRFRALSVDLRGHGESAHTPPYGQPVYAQDVAALVDALELERPILVGHSMGGAVASRAAGALGARLQALVLVDAGFGPPPRPPGEEEQPRFRDQIEPEERIFESFAEARERFRLRPGDTVAAPELLDHLARHALIELPDGRYRWRFDPSIARRGPPQRVPVDGSAVRCPIVAIYGAHSPMLRRVDPRTLVERFPSAASLAVEILDGAHHHVFLDQPETFNALLLDRLERIR